MKPDIRPNTGYKKGRISGTSLAKTHIALEAHSGIRRTAIIAASGMWDKAGIREGSRKWQNLNFSGEGAV